MDEKRAASWAGLSVIGGILVGFVSLLAGVFAIMNEYDYVGGGLCFLASALAFSFLANAIYRE